MDFDCWLDLKVRIALKNFIYSFGLDAMQNLLYTKKIVILELRRVTSECDRVVKRWGNTFGP